MRMNHQGWNYKQFTGCLDSPLAHVSSIPDAMMSILFIFLLIVNLVTATNVNLPNNIYKYDSDGNVLDAHDGKLYYFDGVYYFYGTSYNCGFRWRTSNFTTPFCGFKQYSSTDLRIWKDEGYMFNANTTYYQTLCADTAACFRPKVIRNPTTGQYVMWMNSGSSNYSYTAFTSMSPTGRKLAMQISSLSMPTLISGSNALRLGRVIRVRCETTL